jgi:hypothetical protein
LHKAIRINLKGNFSLMLIKFIATIHFFSRKKE